MSTLTRIKAIRMFCLDCAGGERATVRNCSFVDCALHPHRLSKRPSGTQPAKVIHNHCKSCIGGKAFSCTTDACPLHAFRTGRKEDLALAGGYFPAHKYILGRKTYKGMDALIQCDGELE